MVAGGDSQRDSERDYEPQASTVSEYYFDGEDEDDPGATQLARQLSKGSKVCLTGLEPQPSRLKIDLPLTRASPALDRL